MTVAQMTAKRCYACSSDKAPYKEQPVLRIGRFYGVRYCCKKHYNDSADDLNPSLLLLKRFSTSSIISVRPDDCSSVELYSDGSPRRGVSATELSRCAGNGASQCGLEATQAPILAYWDATLKRFKCFCSIEHLWWSTARQFGAKRRGRRSSTQDLLPDSGAYTNETTEGN